MTHKIIKPTTQKKREKEEENKPTIMEEKSK